MAAASERTTGLDETELPADAGGWLPLRGKSGHARAVDRVAASGARQPPPRAAQHACWLGLAPDVGKRRWLPLAHDFEASMLAAASLPEWNANSHADRHGHGCPSAPAKQHSRGAHLTAALQR